ncbi:uncharacterized protein A4U43_C08F970 [Asparagus officinalis]|nr:uncharacterized protein A4U43_C08F970 [Asparagus officinalis]
MRIELSSLYCQKQFLVDLYTISYLPGVRLLQMFCRYFGAGYEAGSKASKEYSTLFSQQRSAPNWEEQCLFAVGSCGRPVAVPDLQPAMINT